MLRDTVKTRNESHCDKRRRTNLGIQDKHLIYVFFSYCYMAIIGVGKIVCRSCFITRERRVQPLLNDF